jgi:hypothetical protein
MRIVLARSTGHSAPHYSSLHSTVTSSLLGPNILLSTLFWNTHSKCSSFNVRDQFSYPYKTIDKIAVLCILIFIILNRKWKTIDPSPNDNKHSLSAMCCDYLLNIILICLDFSPKFELFHHCKGNIINLYTVTSFCILISRHDHVLSFFSI